MTGRERTELAQLCRRRETLAKNAVLVHAATLKANFEQQIAAKYSFDRDAVWKQAYELAEAATEKANKAIAAECRGLEIPAEFAPSIKTYWFERGDNAVDKRRSELRKGAYTRIDSVAKDAKLKIEHFSLDTQTKLLASGLESAEAKAFLESIPTPGQLMPPMTLDAIEAAMPKRLR